MTTQTITEFLKQRLREDECLALAAFKDYGDGEPQNGSEWSEIWSGTVQCGPGGEEIACFDSGLSRHIEHHDPARVLREVAAKRRVMERHCEGERTNDHVYCRDCPGDSDGFPQVPIDECPELRDLAAPYSDHPDYREEWRP